MHRLLIVLLLAGTSCSDQVNPEAKGDDTPSSPKSSENDSSSIINDGQYQVEPEIIEHFEISDITNDTNYVKGNPGESKINLMYSNYINLGDTMIVNSSKGGVNYRMGEMLFHDFPTHINPDSSTILIANKIAISYDSIGIFSRKLYIVDINELPKHSISKMHGVSANDIHVGGMSLIFPTPEIHCSDSYKNRITLKNDVANFELIDLLNLMLYEADLNKDNKKEIYIFSFMPCSSLYRVYQIIN